MRVLVCTNAYPPRFVGGAELVAHALARRWAAQGIDVMAFAADLSSLGERHACAVDVYEGLVVHRIATTQTDHNLTPDEIVKPKLEAHFTAVLNEFKPDVVHCHNLAGLSLRIPILAAEHGAAVFVTLHDYWGFCFRNTLLRPGNVICDDTSACAACLFPGSNDDSLRLQLRMRRDFTALAFDHVVQFISPSEHLKTRYAAAGLPSDRIAVIPNGIEVEHFRPSQPSMRTGSLRLLYVGYLGEHKGLAVVLRSLAVTRADVQLDVVGEGSELDSLNALAIRLGIREKVRFRGKVQRPGMSAIYDEVDAVVLPSIWEENQPVCLMEAMASGLPVVASRIGGIPAMIADGQEGLLFAPGNAADLAAKLAVLAFDPGLRQLMGQRGRDRVLRQTYARQADQIMRLFEVAEAATTRELQRLLAVPLGADLPQLHDRMWSSISSFHLVLPAWLTARLARQVTAVLIGFSHRRLCRFLARSRTSIKRVECLSPGKRRRIGRQLVNQASSASEQRL